MTDPSEIRYLNIRPDYRQYDVGPAIVSGHHRSWNVFIPQEGCYSSSALTFGDFIARSSQVVLLEKTLQLVGELSNQVASHSRTTVTYDGTMFARISAFFVRICNEHGTRVGYMLRVFWAKMSDAMEDFDLADMKDGPRKEKIIANRKRERDPDYYLQWMLNGREQDVKEFWASEKKVKSPRYWYHTMTRATYLNQFVPLLSVRAANDFEALANPNNPANLHNLLSIERAIQEMRKAGAAPNFLEPSNWPRNGIDIEREYVCRVLPTELHWDFLGGACFPDIERPAVDQTTDEFRSHYHRYYTQAAENRVFRQVAQDADEATRAKVEADNEHLRAEIGRQAAVHAVYVMELMMSQRHELASQDTFRAATKARLEQEMARAREGKSGKEADQAAALAKLRVQQEQLRKFDVFIRRTPALSESYVAIRDYLFGYLGDREKQRGKPAPNFWRDIKPPKEFSNLTRFGAYIAMQPLEQEAVHETYTVHRHAITASLCIPHTYFTHPSLHPNPLMMADAKAGKSFIAKQAASFIPGTTTDSMGESDLAKFTNDAKRRFQYQAVVLEELPPSMVGFDPKAAAVGKFGKTHQAMTDNASRVRHLQTSNKITRDRLVQNPSTGRFETEHIEYVLHQVLVGAINLASHNFPENMLSRWLPLEILSRQREGGYTLSHRVLYPKPGDKSWAKADVYERTRLSQGLLAMAALMMDLGIIAPPSFTAARGFIDEVIELATERGLPGMSDIRHLQRVQGLMEVLCVSFTQWEFYTDPQSPVKNCAHSWEHFLAQEKHFSVSIEMAVFVLTLCEEQFEPALAFEVLSAIDKTFGVLAGQRGQLAMEDYAKFNISDGAPERKFGGGGDQNGSKNSWCRKLFGYIEGNMKSKPAKEAGVNFIESLCETQVLSANSQRPIAALIIDSSGDCKIANVLLHNLHKDRLLRCVQEVLCRQHYRPQRWVLGRLNEKAPFIWKTFSTDPADMEDRERVLYTELRQKAEETRRKDLASLPAGTQLPGPDVAVRFQRATCEDTIWRILQRHGGRHTEEAEADLRRSLLERRYEGIVVLVDRDREDAGAVADWRTKGATREVFETLLGPEASRPQLPSQKNQAYKELLQQLVQQTLSEMRQDATQERLAAFRYPTCFEARDPGVFLKNALAAAIRAPEQSLLSQRMNEDMDILGFAGGEEKKRAVPRPQPPQPPGPPSPPPPPPPQRESKALPQRSALQVLGQPINLQSSSSSSSSSGAPSGQKRAVDASNEQEQQQRASKRQKTDHQQAPLFASFVDFMEASDQADEQAQRLAESEPQQAAAVSPEKKKKQASPEKKVEEKEKKKKEKGRRRIADSDGEDLRAEAQRYEDMAAELGMDEEIGVEVTGNSEDLEAPEVVSDEADGMVSSLARIREEEAESARLANAEDKECADAEDCD